MRRPIRPRCMGTSSDPSKRVTMTATMRKAMNYFEDCKKGGHIDSFLYDSNVPADNTYCERNIRGDCFAKETAVSFRIQMKAPPTA